MEERVKELSKYRFETSLENLEDAKLMFENGRYKNALNRAYYSIFHAIRSVNTLKGFDSSKHSRVIAFFNQSYVKEPLQIQPNIKEQAEAILDRLGIPVSVFIDMTYRQVIMRDGVPFSLDIPDKLVTRDSITQAEFDTMMQTGLAQAKKNDSVSVDEAFNQLKSEI